MKFATYRDRDNYDTRHGGPFDRGSADSYYHRGITPHYYVEGTSTSPRIEEVQMTEKEISDYEYKKTPLKQGSKAQNLNIRISPNMDEWSKLTLL